jgi:thiosulfate reductase cytochrome b subunit
MPRTLSAGQHRTNADPRADRAREAAAVVYTHRWPVGDLVVGRSGSPPQRDAKYTPLLKLFHKPVAAVVLAIVVTGLLMLSKIDTPFWRRNSYWLTEARWGMIYAIHRLCAMAMIMLIMMHVYFAACPEKWRMTRSPMSGIRDRVLNARTTDGSCDACPRLAGLRRRQA